MLTSERRHVRAKLANASARAATDPQAAAEVDHLRREYRYLATEDYLKRVVAEAPRLTADQRSTLAALLRPAGGGAA